ALADSRSLCASRGCRGRRADELWGRSCGHVSSGRRLHGANPQRCKASRTAGLAVEQIRVRHQRANGEVARHRGAQRVATARRRGDRMKRRKFITLLGGAAVSWPLAARAQQRERMRRVGVLMGRATDDPEGQARITAFAQGLQQLGWTVGRNLRIDYRWGAGDVERSRKYGAELVALGPDVILASGGPPVVALHQATRTVPIVFTIIA